MVIAAQSWRNLGLLGLASIVWFVVTLIAIRNLFHLTLYDFQSDISLDYPPTQDLPLWWMLTLLLYAPSTLLPPVWTILVIETVIPPGLLLGKIVLRTLATISLFVGIIGVMLFFIIFSQPFESSVDLFLLHLRAMTHSIYHTLLQVILILMALWGWQYRFLPRSLALSNGIAAVGAFSFLTVSLAYPLTERATLQVVGVVLEGVAMILFSAYFLLYWQSELAKEESDTTLI
jgi:hypothetical protein